jgi:dTDP-4-dehydrorhamnose reductase
MTDRPIVVLGAEGQVGRETLPLLREHGMVVGLTRADLDLANPDSIRTTVRRLNPRWIVNAAAYTAVDKAESDPRTAFAVNAEALGVLGEEAFRLGVPMVHFSTDYVFDGSGSDPWVEADPMNPLSVYGASKLAGERALAASGAAHFIFRTSWVFGTHGKNFLLTILKLAREREELKIVDDQYGAPTWSRNLAQLSAQSVAYCEAEARRNRVRPDEALQTIGGIYHACSGGFTSWFGFATEILRIEQAAHPGRVLARLTPIDSAAYPTAAERPKNSRLSCEKLRRAMGFEMPSWEEATAQAIQHLSPE